jgi:hypothetical protein
MSTLINAFNNNRNDVVYINGTTSRVSVLVEGISYQFERELGSNVINCVGNDCSFEIPQSQVVQLDREIIINSECRTTRTEMLTEFKKVIIRGLRRKRPYDVRKEGDKDLTAEEVKQKFVEYGCDHIFGLFYFVAHMADCCGIAHVGYNAYSESDTIAACNKINRFPLTFESVRKTLNVSKAWLDYALRKIEADYGWDGIRTTLVKGNVYNTTPIELFSPRVIDFIKATRIDADPDTIKYVSAQMMCDYIGKERAAHYAALANVGIYPSKRERAYYILADGADRNKLLNTFCYTMHDMVESAGVSELTIRNWIKSGAVSAENTTLVQGATYQRRFNEAGMAEIIAKAVASSINDIIDQVPGADSFYNA